MPPRKELHYFDRSQHYASPNRLTTSSPIQRLIGSNPWERQKMWADIKMIMHSVKKRNIHKTIWWSKWTFGFYNDGWYRKLFSLPAPCKACGEITPSYSMLDTDDVERIKAFNPNMKLIFLIRNPIERAWSAIRFNAHISSKFNLDSEDEIISALKQPGMTLRGNYERTIDAYLKYFNTSQFLVCFYDAIIFDPLGLMAAITDFLEITPFDKSAVDNATRINPSPAYKLPVKIKEYLGETYTPMINRIAEKFGSYATRWIGSKNSIEKAPSSKSQSIQFPPSFHP